MLLPAGLPKNLAFVAEATSDEELHELLIKQPPALMRLMVSASGDVDWCYQHKIFMNSAFTWLTQQFFQDKLLMANVQKMVRGLRNHYVNVAEYIPRNLTLKLQDRELPFSSLFLGSGSEFLRVLVRRECRDKRKTVLSFKEIPYHLFMVIEEYLTTGEYLELVRKDKKENLKILRIAMEWELEELSKGCQEHLKMYITRENVFDTLLRAHTKQRIYLEQACFDFLNAQLRGYRLESRGPETLGFEFLDFNESSLAAFNKVKAEITHLIARKDIPEHPEFLQVIKECPKLQCIDIGASSRWNDQLLELPGELSELELNSCTWLGADELDKLVTTCPNLTRLTLQSHARLDMPTWTSLTKLPFLRILDLTRCQQISSTELAAILQAAPDLIDLTLEECRSLDDKAFYDLPGLNAKLTKLNIARTFISDQPLLELATRCEALIYLNLTRCENVTGPTLVEVTRHAKQLKELIIVLCDVTPENLKEIKKSRPYLLLKF